jgi:hypothetical protein
VPHGICDFHNAFIKSIYFIPSNVHY